MTCDNGLNPTGEESSNQAPVEHTDALAAGRQFERFMREIDPGFSIVLDGRGDEHLTLEELTNRRRREALLRTMIDEEQSNEVIATVVIHKDTNRIEIIDRIKKPEDPAV